jgi:hypothetical protein
VRHFLAWSALLSMLAYIATGTKEFAWAGGCFFLAHQLGRGKE